MSAFFETIYPNAKIPKSNEIGKSIPCIHCKRKILVSKWDTWNGFLVKCPYCNKYHGKHFNKKAILLGSFFFHALGFFFTVRPLKALLLIIIFGGIGVFGNYLLTKELLPQLLEIVLVILFLFAPMILNGIFILFHEKKLNSSKGMMQENVTSILEEVISFFI